MPRKMNMTPAQKLKGIRKALASKKTPKQLRPWLKKQAALLARKVR